MKKKIKKVIIAIAAIGMLFGGMTAYASTQSTLIREPTSQGTLLCSITRPQSSDTANVETDFPIRTTMQTGAVLRNISTNAIINNATSGTHVVSFQQVRMPNFTSGRTVTGSHHVRLSNGAVHNVVTRLSR